MLILKYKVKFIKLKIENVIIIEKRKKNDILSDIKNLEFPKLSLKVDVAENEKSYNYITNMELFSLTEEKIEELNNEYNNKLKELENYKNTTLEQLWGGEINEFIIEYKKIIKELNNNAKVKKNKFKKNKKNKKIKVKTK